MGKEAIRVLDYNGLEYLIGKIKGEISGEEHDYTVFDMLSNIFLSVLGGTSLNSLLNPAEAIIKAVFIDTYDQTITANISEETRDKLWSYFKNTNINNRSSIIREYTEEVLSFDCRPASNFNGSDEIIFNPGAISSLIGYVVEYDDNGNPIIIFEGASYAGIVDGPMTDTLRINMRIENLVAKFEIFLTTHEVNSSQGEITMQIQQASLYGDVTYGVINLSANGDPNKYLNAAGEYAEIDLSNYATKDDIAKKDYTVFDIVVNTLDTNSITQENYDKLVAAAGDEMISADCRPYGGQNPMMYDFCVFGKSSDGGVEVYMRANNYALMNYCNYVVYVNISSTLSVTSTITSNAIIADSAGDVSVMADGESVMLKKSGDGNSYLADDGTYRAIDLSSYATAASVTAIENQIGNISTLLTTINGE